MRPSPKGRIKCTCSQRGGLHSEKCAVMQPRTAASETAYRRGELLAAANCYGQRTMTPTHGGIEARLSETLTSRLLYAAKGYVAALEAEIAALAAAEKAGAA